MFPALQTDFLPSEPQGSPDGTNSKKENKTTLFANAGDPGFDLSAGKIPWRRAWQPTPVLSPGESHGQRGRAGYSPRGGKEVDVTEPLTYFFSAAQSDHVTKFLATNGIMLNSKQSP